MNAWHRGLRARHTKCGRATKAGSLQIFAAYAGIEILGIYRVKPENLEYYFQRWEDKWHRDGKRDINNPKIPLNYVIQNGDMIFGAESGGTLFA
ncbi:MAG: hypothetical protein Rubg2KO_36530 [Rubricoccaceae bacterium]